MQSLSQLTQILYEIAMDIGNGVEMRPMLKESLSTFLRKLSGFGAVVLADRLDGGSSYVELVYMLPDNLFRNDDASRFVESLLTGDSSRLPPTDWSSPEAVPCGDGWIYRLDLPGYGTLLLLKSVQLEPMVVRSLRQVCGKLAGACTACENAAELAESRERLQVTFDAIGDAVIVTDKAGSIRRMNPVAENLTGWHLDDALNRSLPEVFKIINGETREIAANPVEQVLQSGQIVGLANHTLLISKDGRELQIADSGAPICDRGGEIVGVVLVFRDVTEEYAIQEQLTHSRKMDALGQLAGGIAHDFNNMLGGIVGAADVLELKVADNPEALRFQKIIMDTANRAAELTQQLLSFARKRPVLADVLDVNQVIKSTLLLLNRTIDRKIEIETYLASEPVHVVGDASQLQSALLNLGINAWHSMPDGGKLTILTRVVELDDAYCRTNAFDIAPGSYVDIEVRDTGSGIEPELLSRIFEPFFTTKTRGRGTGLGLASVFGAVKQHHGTVWVYSEEGQGSCFHVMLPRTNEELPEGFDVDDVVHGSGTILIIDDEDAMLVTAEAILQDLGYTVLMAKDGNEGLQVFEDNHSTIDAVILDMIMPKMDGYDCFSAIREIDSEAKVILASGFTREEYLKEMKEKGLADFIMKPFNKKTLSTVIRKVIGGRR